jgi:hypothetical protein
LRFQVCVAAFDNRTGAELCYQLEIRDDPYHVLLYLIATFLNRAFVIIDTIASLWPCFYHPYRWDLLRPYQ